MLFPSLMHKLAKLIISSFVGVTLPKFYSVANMFLRIFQEFWYKTCAKLFKLASSMYFLYVVSRFKSSDEFGITMTS